MSSSNELFMHPQECCFGAYLLIINISVCILIPNATNAALTVYWYENILLLYIYEFWNIVVTNDNPSFIHVKNDSIWCEQTTWDSCTLGENGMLGENGAPALHGKGSFSFLYETRD